MLKQKVEPQVIELALQKVNSESEVRQAIQGGMKAMQAWEKYGVL